MRLRTRFVLAAVVLGTVLTVIGFVLPRIVRDAQLAQTDRLLAATLPAAASIASGPLQLGVSSGGFNPVRDALSGIYIARLEVDGRDVLIRPQSNPTSEPDEPATSGNSRQAPHPTTVGSTHGTLTWRAAIVTSDGGARLLVAVPLDRVEQTQTELSGAILIASVVVLLVIIASGSWLFRFGLRPIAELTLVADAISDGDRSRRAAHTQAGTEAAHLARAFNVMLDEQQNTEDRLRSFVADASHELRTPVTAISGLVDLYRDDAIDPGQIDDVMRRIGRESRRMRALVEDMLALARLDGQQPLELRTADIVQLVMEATLDAHASHPSRTITVTGQSSAPCVIDERQMRQVSANILANALNHTDGAISIDVGTTDDATTLIFTDQGPGLDAGDSARMFDRFWRHPSARSTPGNGLGLAIARSIVESHSGSIAIDTSPDAGTTVTVVLPGARHLAATDDDATTHEVVADPQSMSATSRVRPSIR